MPTSSTAVHPARNETRSLQEQSVFIAETQQAIDDVKAAINAGERRIGELWLTVARLEWTLDQLAENPSSVEEGGP